VSAAIQPALEVLERGVTENLRAGASRTAGLARKIKSAVRAGMGRDQVFEVPGTRRAVVITDTVVTTNYSPKRLRHPAVRWKVDTRTFAAIECADLWPTAGLIKTEHYGKDSGDVGRMASMAIASCFFAELPADSGPWPGSVLLKCRIPPGQHLLNMMVRLRPAKAYYRVGGSSTEWVETTICDEDQFEKLKGGEAYCKTIALGAVSYQDNIDICLGSKQYNIGSSPCTMGWLLWKRGQFNTETVRTTGAEVFGAETSQRVADNPQGSEEEENRMRGLVADCGVDKNGTLWERQQIGGQVENGQAELEKVLEEHGGEDLQDWETQYALSKTESRGEDDQEGKGSETTEETVIGDDGSQIVDFVYELREGPGKAVFQGLIDHARLRRAEAAEMCETRRELTTLYELKAQVRSEIGNRQLRATETKETSELNEGPHGSNAQCRLQDAINNLQATIQQLKELVPQIAQVESTSREDKQSTDRRYGYK
jgi:hypothetical protein